MTLDLEKVGKAIAGFGEFRVVPGGEDGDGYDQIDLMDGDGDFQSFAEVFADECAEPIAEILNAAPELHRLALDATRVCDKPGCSAAVVRRDDGARVCAAGHPSRWVEKSDLDAARAEVERYKTMLTTLGADVERLTEWLKRANDASEDFERRWYLATDDVERLRAALGEIVERLGQCMTREVREAFGPVIPGPGNGGPTVQVYAAYDVAERALATAAPAANAPHRATVAGIALIREGFAIAENHAEISEYNGWYRTAPRIDWTVAERELEKRIAAGREVPT